MNNVSERNPQVLLQVEDLHVAYGKAEVVHGVSFDVRAGEFVVLLGRNGAGKSTMLHAISGLIPKRRGTVVFEGVDLSAATPRQIVQAGVVQVLEGHRVFHTLTVEDNLLIGTYARHPRGDRSRPRRDLRALPGTGGSPAAGGVAAVRRPAADPCGRAGRHRRAAPADPRRAVRRPRADRHRPHPGGRRRGCAPTASPSCWWSSWWRRPCAMPTTAT